MKIISFPPSPYPRLWVYGAAAVALIVVLIGGALILRPPVPLLANVAITPEHITPNADGDADVMRITYSLARPARVSITFTAENGTAYAFRSEEARAAGDYAVNFGGIVDGFVLPGERVIGEVEARLIPNGSYEWAISAFEGDSAESQTVSGAFNVSEGEAELPQILDFDVHPPTFTPNQDGISDRMTINAYLSKEAALSVYLVDADGTRIYIPESEIGREPGEPGRHTYDYDGGIDNGLEPPDDGTYTVLAVAEDAAGQRVTRTDSVTLVQGGLPLAEIAADPNGASAYYVPMAYDEALFSGAEMVGQRIALPEGGGALIESQTIPLGNMIAFRLTIWNYGSVPIRTTGPAPGTVYQQDQRASTLGWYEESGAWRVGMDCNTAYSDYPWRWAVGAESDLVAVDGPDGDVYYYLPPDGRGTVWGAVRFTEITPSRNPQYCWFGLIHEDVGISQQNRRVAARQVEIVPPPGEEAQHEPD